MASQNNDLRNENAEKGRGIISQLFHGLTRLPLLLLLSLAISICIEWTGIIFDWWDSPGHLHSREMMIAEARYLSDSFSETKFGQMLLSTGVYSVQWLDSTANDWFQLSDMSDRPPEHLSVFEVGFASAVYMTKVFLLRLTVVIFSSPLFVVMGLVGITFGLIGRDLRRFGAATEHKKRFTLYWKLINPSIGLSAAVYLTYWNTANPVFILVPAAFLFSYALENAIKNFQKSF